MKEQDVPATAPAPLPLAPPPPASLTRTERCFYELLADGQPHSIPELTQHLWDQLSVNLRVLVKVWIAKMRPKLPPGIHIIPISVNGFLHYQLVRDL